MRPKRLTSSNYTCPLCFQRTLSYPRATITHGHMGWYVQDCKNCVQYEILREENGYGVTICEHVNEYIEDDNI